MWCVYFCPQSFFDLILWPFLYIEIESHYWIFNTDLFYQSIQRGLEGADLSLIFRIPIEYKCRCSLSQGNLFTWPLGTSYIGQSILISCEFVLPKLYWLSKDIVLFFSFFFSPILENKDATINRNFQSRFRTIDQFICKNINVLCSVFLFLYNL